MGRPNSAILKLGSCLSACSTPGTASSGSHTIRKWSKVGLFELLAFNGQVSREPAKEIEGKWLEMGAGVGSQGPMISASLSVVDKM